MSVELQSYTVEILKETDIAKAVRVAFFMSEKLGFSKNEQFFIGTSASELARNIYQYAKTGSVYLSEVTKDGLMGLEIKALDQGPGIEDIDLAMQDHYSTGGTLGLGLPGVKRMMDDFLIESKFTEGTSINCIKWRR